MNEWIYKNGFHQTVCTSFPYAFRLMYNAVKKNLASGIEQDTSKITIISPQKDSFGENKVFTYDEAVQLAKSMDLLNADDMINSREFRKK